MPAEIDPNESPAGPNNIPTITEDQALQSILDAYLDADVEETELMHDNGVLVYEVEPENAQAVLVDANSSEINGTEAENE